MATWLDNLTEDELWKAYGMYADAKVQIDEMPPPFDDWLKMERQLAGEQNELF